MGAYCAKSRPFRNPKVIVCTSQSETDIREFSEMFVLRFKFVLLLFNCFFGFKVCKSVHHHTIQINQPTRCNNFSGLLLDVYLQLNVFWASSRPSSGAQWLQWQPLVLPSYCGDSHAVFVVGPDGWPAQPRPTALLSPRSEGKTRGRYCSCWAPDDGREDAQNTLSCK